MNPYDFVRIDWEKKPLRKEPLWHHRLTPINTDTLYSGHLNVQMKAERPLFLPAPGESDPTKLISFLQSKHGNKTTYIVPGSSLKGMLRTVAETLSNSCLSMFGETYRYRHFNKPINVDYSAMIPPDFRKCQKHKSLCISCRMFGMMERDQNAAVFLGKINISDACSIAVVKHDPVYTIPLTSPKPHHRAFYLNQGGKWIAGRKYYFHHDCPTFAYAFERFSPDKPPVNRYIQPLGEGSCFEFAIDFVNLEADEFALLLLALTLEPEMRHKIGYGKPMGLGSVHLTPTKLKLIDYARRYSLNGRAEAQIGLEGTELETWISVHTTHYKSAHLLDKHGMANETLTDLRRIWGWPPRKDITYHYPEQSWFDDHRTARISKTL